ncbi:MAG: Crp/Fnr family transcriptional regulator [Acidimicrobiaceae bacterium]|nr:Crp/Fnr family transcriptional regulator [Acidimicrobiaceae bacterium]
MAELLYVSDVAPYRRTDGHLVAAGVHQSLGSAALAFEEVAGLCGLEFRQVGRARDATADALASARVLVLFTIGETPWSPEQMRVIEERAGRGELGIVAVHAATDSSYGWSKFGELVGARFDGHPVTGELPITVLDPTHPATAHLPSPWRFKDELYLFRDVSPDARVLLAVEMGALGSAGDSSRLPLAWCIERGPTRTFYTALGHFLSAYEDGNYLEHLRGAVEWVLGHDSTG